MVEVEGLTYDGKSTKVPLVVLKPSVMPSVSERYIFYFYKVYDVFKEHWFLSKENKASTFRQYVKSITSRFFISFFELVTVSCNLKSF